MRGAVPDCGAPRLHPGYGRRARPSLEVEASFRLPSRSPVGGAPPSRSLMPMTAVRTILKYSWLALVVAAIPASAGTSRIYITNSAGDAINVIDPETNTVVQNIKGIEAAHGINFSPDGTRVYVSNESDSTLDVFDQKSGNLIKKVT